jgi:hypothetical protein
MLQSAIAFVCQPHAQGKWYREMAVVELVSRVLRTLTLRSRRLSWWDLSSLGASRRRKVLILVTDLLVKRG